MKVKDLIAELQKQDPEAKVIGTFESVYRELCSPPLKVRDEMVMICVSDDGVYF